MNQENKPIRVQRKRTKGWRMPENTVYVGRPTKYGNTIKVDAYRNHAQAVADFEALIERNKNEKWIETLKQELKGKNLACWCALDKPCHADILLKIANEG